MKDSSEGAYTYSSPTPETNIQKLHPEMFRNMAPGPLDDYFFFTGRFIREHDNWGLGSRGSRIIEEFKDGELVSVDFESYEVDNV